MSRRGPWPGGDPPAWSLTPMFLLRRSALERASAGWPAARFLEVGAGTGRMTREFLDRGFTGTCWDPGETSRRALAANLAPYGDRARVAERLEDVPPGSVQYLFAFEVLEHVEDDAAALGRWLAALRPGGRVLLTVPAGRRFWSPDDEAMGHRRRYERHELEALLAGAGLDQRVVANYGFPLANLSIAVKRRLFRLGLLAAGGGSPAERSEASGVTRPALTRRLAALWRPALLAPFVVLSNRWPHRDLGPGFVASARRPGDGA